MGVLEEIEYNQSDAVSYDYDLSGTTITIPNSSLLIETSGRPTDYYSSDVELQISMTFKSTGVRNSVGVRDDWNRHIQYI